MRSTWKLRPCVCCELPTTFQRAVYGPRGRLLRWESCCPECGESLRPAKHKEEAA